MVVSIRVKNFFSIKEEAVLDFTADFSTRASRELLPQNLITQGEEAFVNIIGLFGSNAAGKSNFIKALRFCRDLILSSHLNNEGAVFDFTPFKFSDSKDSEFYISFFHEGLEYEYGFAINGGKVIREELYYYPKKRRSRIFVRENGEYSFGKGLIARPAEVVANTSDKTLFLSRASAMNRPIAQSLYRFFLEKFLIGIGNQTLATLTKETFEKYKEVLLVALEASDSDILDIRMEEDKNGVPVLYSYHKENPAIRFDFEKEESDGTRRLLMILTQTLKSALEGATIFMDEFDLKLHLRLAEFILDVVRATKSAQMVFTSHNPSLLSLSQLRPEQIVFVTKHSDGNSELVPLSDYEGINSKVNLQKAYLQGRFDAVPYVGDPYRVVSELFGKNEGEEG